MGVGGLVLPLGVKCGVQISSGLDLVPSIKICTSCKFNTKGYSLSIVRRRKSGVAARPTG